MEPFEKDDAFAWKAATVIMLVFSLVALSTMLLGTNPFSILFNVALVYLPTVILLGSVIFDRSRQSS